MPYRNDQTALRVRKLALENELQGLQQRADEARRLTAFERDMQREIQNINSVLGTTAPPEAEAPPAFRWLRPLTVLAGAIGLLLCGGAGTAYTMWLVDSTTLSPLDDLRDAQRRERALEHHNQHLERQLRDTQVELSLERSRLIFEVSHRARRCDHY